MNNIQIDYFMRRFIADEFCGVFAYDKFLNEEVVEKNKCYYIVNTDPSWKKGIHWLLFYKSEQTLYFFDSLGYCLKHYPELSEKFEGFQIIENHFRTQSINSRACGMFCLYVAIKLYNHCKYKKILLEFSKTDYYCNELMVFDFLKRIMN